MLVTGKINYRLLTQMAFELPLSFSLRCVKFWQLFTWSPSFQKISNKKKAIESEQQSFLKLIICTAKRCQIWKHRPIFGVWDANDYERFYIDYFLQSKLQLLDIFVYNKNCTSNIVCHSFVDCGKIECHRSLIVGHHFSSMICIEYDLNLFHMLDVMKPNWTNEHVQKKETKIHLIRLVKKNKQSLMKIVKFCWKCSIFRWKRLKYPYI